MVEQINVKGIMEGERERLASLKTSFKSNLPRSRSNFPA